MSAAAAGIKAVVRKVIRKQLRHERDGVQLSADVDAVIAVNVGGGAKTTCTVVQSTHHVQQGGAGQRGQPDVPPEDPTGPTTKETP